MNSGLKRMSGVAASLVVTAGLVSGISVVLSNTAEARSTMVTATSSVNVRSGPGTQYRVVGALGTGQSLPVKGQAEDGWTQVGFSGATAWISSRYVVASADDAGAQAAKASKGWRYGTTALNVRTGPSLSAAVVTVAAKGYGFEVTGENRNGYTEVNFKGKVRWVTSRYLTEKEPGSSSPAKTEWRYGTVPLNVRTEPTSSARVVDVAGTGYGFTFHGTTRNGFAEVTFGGSTRWVSAQYLSRTEPTAGKPPAEKPQQGAEEWRYGTVALNIRTGPSLGASVIDVAVRGYGFTTDGTTRSGFTEVTFKGQKRWVTAQYLTSTKPGGTTAPAPTGNLPKVTGHKYATTALDIRSASENSTTYSEVPKGTKLAVTGKVENGRAQIVYNEAVRWVTAQYLSTTQPGSGAGGSSGGGSSVSLPGLTANSRYLLARLQARYPQVSTYYGVRADPIPDHPSGRALDAMVPSYSSASGQALGRDMAEWIKDNASELNVEYIIFNQRIWNVRRAGEGWRYMADRGSDNANHKNHVHITTSG